MPESLLRPANARKIDRVGKCPEARVKSIRLENDQKLVRAGQGEKMLRSMPGLKNAQKFDKVRKGKGARKG